MDTAAEATQIETTVRTFLEADGALVVYSDDRDFSDQVAQTVEETFSQPKDTVYASMDETAVYNVLQRRHERELATLLFIEREMHQSSTNEFIKMIKNQFPEVLVIVLTSEVDRPVIVYLHEIGVDNFITKPLSRETLLEKVAYTVKPPSKIGHLMDQAKQLAFDGEPQKALQVCDKILEIKPQSPAGLMLLGDIHKQMGNGEKAVQAYEEAHQSERMYLEPIKKLSTYYREKGDREKELEQLKKLDQLSPLNVDRKMMIGDIQLHLGDADQAENLYEDMIDVTRQEMTNKMYRMHLDVAEKMLPVDPKRAEKYFRKALETKKDLLGPKDVNAFNRLGMALRRQKKPKEAVQEYTKALELAPEDENLYYNMALAYLEAGDTHRSLKAVQKALSLNESLGRDNERIAYNIGLVFLKSKDTAQAAAYFEHALEVNDGYEPAVRMLRKMDKM